MKLQSLELHLKYGEIKGTDKTLADKLILESLSLGLNELHVTNFNRPDYRKLRLRRREYMLPAQVFETTTLTKLSARYCRIDSARGGRVLCSRLVSLNLHGSFIDPYVLEDILLVCVPSIQNLVLDVSLSPTEIDLTPLRNLVHLDVWSKRARDCSAIDFRDAPVDLQFCNMTTLRLEQVLFDEDFFFTQFSRLFPSVENLTLIYSTGCKEIRISSRSVNYLELDQGHVFKTARLEVPNIRKLILKVKCIPSLSLIRSSSGSSKEWESHVQWNCGIRGDFKGARFLELRNLLTELSESKISLHFNIDSYRFGLKGDLLPCFPTPVPLVENLKVSGSTLTFEYGKTLFGGLFKICHPRFVTLNKYSANMYKRDIPMLLKLVSDTSSLHKTDKYNQETEQMDLINPHMYGLKEVILEILDNNLKEWSTITLGNSIDASSIQDIIHQIRFHFIWRGVGEPEPSLLAVIR